MIIKSRHPTFHENKSVVGFIDREMCLIAREQEEMSDVGT